MKYLQILERELKKYMIRKYQIFLLFISVFLLLFSSYYIKDFRVDASSDSLVSQNDKDFQYFKYYQKIFPTKNSLLIAIESKKKIDINFLKELDNISKKISKIEEISSVFSINEAPILFLNNTSLLDLSNSNIETILNSDYRIEDVLNEFSNSPIYSDQIINKDKNIGGLIIFLKPNLKLQNLSNNKFEYLNDKIYYDLKSEIDNDRKNLILKIRNIINNADKNYTYYLGGVEMISNDVISYVKSDILIFSSLVLFLVLIILLIIFRKIKWVFSILISSSFAVYVMAGLIGYLNFEISAVSSNFISLMFILSVSMNIHILNNFLNNKNNLLECLKGMILPCFYTFLTTVVAFFSLVISDIKPVIDFGYIMIIALFVLLISSFTFFPLMISFFLKESSDSKLKINIIENFIYFSKKYTKSIIFLNIILFILAIYGVTNLKIENSFIKYFKKNSEIYKGMKLIDSELGGTTPLDIIIKFKNDEYKIINDENDLFEDEIEIDDDFFSEELFDNNNNNIWFTEKKINIIKKIHQYLETRIEIGKVNSIYSLINVANQINKNELSSFELSVLYNEIPDEYKNELIDPFLNIEENIIKISARIKDSYDIERIKLVSEINDFITNSIDDVDEVKINGLLVLYNNMLSSLFNSQIKSLGFVLLAIFIMFIILFRSIKLSIIGIIPNIFASTFILGLIGILKIPLDIMTITIAAISIGIAVDNTIHYLYRYKLNMKKSLDTLKSIEDTHLTVGNAVFTTSIAISISFLILCFSNFIPTIIFGLFTSLAMIFAMIGVLITLPSILYYYKKI